MLLQKTDCQALLSVECKAYHGVIVLGRTLFCCVAAWLPVIISIMMDDLVKHSLRYSRGTVHGE